MFEFDESTEQGAIIKAIGIGEWGRTAVQQMEGRVHNLQCITPASCTSEDILKAVHAADMVFVLASLNDEKTVHIMESSLATFNSKSCLYIRVSDKLRWNDGVPPQDIVNISTNQLPLLIASDDSFAPLDAPARQSQFYQAIQADPARLAIKTLTDLIITCGGFMGIDYIDVKSRFDDSSKVRMGCSLASGSKRAEKTASKAIDSLASQGVALKNALGVICAISGSNTMTMDDYIEVNRLIRVHVHEETRVLIGTLKDDNLGDSIMVTILTMSADNEKAEQVFRLRAEQTARAAKIPFFIEDDLEIPQ